jgi:histidine ammonia-lyase
LLATLQMVEIVEQRRAIREQGHEHHPLDGTSLTRAAGVCIARTGEDVSLSEAALARVKRAADFLAAKVARGEPIYGVTTGFGSNADKLLGAHPCAMTCRRQSEATRRCSRSCSAT